MHLIAIIILLTLILTYPHKYCQYIECICTGFVYTRNKICIHHFSKRLHECLWRSNALNKFVLCFFMLGRQSIVSYSFTSIFVYHLNFRVSSCILIKPIVIYFLFLVFLESPFFMYFRVPVYLAQPFFIYLRVLKYTNNDTRNMKHEDFVYKALQ